MDAAARPDLATLDLLASALHVRCQPELPCELPNGYATQVETWFAEHAARLPSAERSRGADLRAAASAVLAAVEPVPTDATGQRLTPLIGYQHSAIDALTAALAPEPQGGLQPTREPPDLRCGCRDMSIGWVACPWHQERLDEAIRQALQAAAPPSSDAGSPIDVGYAALAADGTVDPKRYHLDPIHHAIVHRVYQGKPPRAAISDAGLSHPGDCPESLRPHDPGTADGCVELTKP